MWIHKFGAGTFGPFEAYFGLFQAYFRPFGPFRVGPWPILGHLGHFGWVLGLFWSLWAFPGGEMWIHKFRAGTFGPFESYFEPFWAFW